MVTLAEHATWHCLEHPKQHHLSSLYMEVQEEIPNRHFQRYCRRLGLQWVSAVDDLLSVRKALATGLFANAAQYISTTVESRDKEHTGVDLYHLVRSSGHGQPSSLLLLDSCLPTLPHCSLLV